MNKNYFLLTAILFITTIGYSQKYENLALTPPMGWNSWNKFACNVSEELIRETADAMVANGMKDAGYVYINIDDCWHGVRDSLGFIQPHPEHFKSGMKALGDYIHSKGLKFGIYSCAGAKTCGGKPAGRGHEYQDALQYARWGVDYLKYDWCDTEGLNAVGAYTTMRDAIYAAGRPVVFSLCEWGQNKPWEWGAKVGHLWRTSGDITSCFDCEDNHGTWSSWGVMKIVDMMGQDIRKYAGPGHWNDPDMLEVGNGMTVNEDRTHFSIWCMLAAPLIAGNDIRNMSKETLEILINKEAIAVNQDPLGIQGFRLETKDSVETWYKPLKDGDWAICFLNRSKVSKKISMDWKTQVINDNVSKCSFNGAQSIYKMRNLWLKKDAGTTKDILNAEIASHDVLMLRLTRISK